MDPIETPTFDPQNTTITYYGPHACADCGRTIVQSSFESGGHRYDIPAPAELYPNTMWAPHVCTAEDIAARPTPTACPNCCLPASGPGLAFPDGTICNAPTHAGSTAR